MNNLNKATRKLRIDLAPLRGVTDSIFRTIFERHFGKFDGMLAPFVSTVKGVTVKRTHIRDLLPERNDTARVIPQIIGKDAADFLLLARTFFDLGYHCVNWNLGCPFPQVVHKKRGAGLLPYPDLIESFLETVVPNLPCPLSIKTRLGLTSHEEIRKLIRVFNRFPLHELIIHARTGSQMYRGTPDLDTFSEVHGLFACPVIYNGDIFTAARLRDLFDRFPSVNGWMIGRGIIRDPLLLPALRGQVHSDRRGTLRSFHTDLFEAYRETLSGPGHLLGKMKELWAYLYHSFEHGDEFLKKIRRIREVRKYLDEVEKLFEI